MKNLQEWISRNKPVAGAKGPFELCFARLQKIEDAHTYLTENQDISSSVQEELFRYIPIATTAAIDAYFKSVMCSGQLIPDSILRFSSAATGEMPPLNA